MRNRKMAALTTVPYVIWMALFVVIPLVLIVVYAFTSKAGGFTLQNFSAMGDYTKVFARSLWLAPVSYTHLSILTFFFSAVIFSSFRA